MGEKEFNALAAELIGLSWNSEGYGTVTTNGEQHTLHGYHKGRWNPCHDANEANDVLETLVDTPEKHAYFFDRFMLETDSGLVSLLVHTRRLCELALLTHLSAEGRLEDE